MISDHALEMIKHHEGVRTRAYRCPARLWTIGVGHVIDPAHIRVPYEKRLELPLPAGWDRALTMEEVNAILFKDLERFEDGVVRLCPGVLANQNHLDSLVSFAFNVGLGNLQRSTLRQRYNRRDYHGAAEAFMSWTKAAGKVLPGLVKRRTDERKLFLGL
jgi:GH24 family phage-related lysozyme (muramidase)